MEVYFGDTGIVAINLSRPYDAYIHQERNIICSDDILKQLWLIVNQTSGKNFYMDKMAWLNWLFMFDVFKG